MVLHCVSVEDAKRRALALAMITLDRKKGDFLKIFSPSQLFTGTFISNIKCWWNLKEIKELIPANFLGNLIKLGGMTVKELPFRAEATHCGLVLS